MRPAPNAHNFLYIGSLDAEPLVNRYSFQPGLVTRDGGQGGTMMDGSVVRDVLAVKLRHTWTLNALTGAQLAALHAMIDNSQTAPVSVTMYDHTRDTFRTCRCFVELEDPPFFDMVYTDSSGTSLDQQFQAGGRLTIEEV